jgi:hypothetical protein
VEFGLLCDVEVWVDGHPVELGHARQRGVLVVLLVEANRAVSVDALAKWVWGDRAPLRARQTLYNSRARVAADEGEGGVSGGEARPRHDLLIATSGIKLNCGNTDGAVEHRSPTYSMVRVETVAHPLEFQRARLQDVVRWPTQPRSRRHGRSPTRPVA